MILFYEYAKCSTCRNARKWLEAKKIKFRSIPIVDEPPTAAQLIEYVEKSKLESKKFLIRVACNTGNSR